ncbi:MAG: flavodoxin [Rikenellaceae bacterium]
MATIKIIYGSTTGNTESAANDIASALSAHTVESVDVGSASKEDFESSDLLILGTSTWGVGDLQDDWESGIDTLKSADLSGKKVALFGCGDADSYCDTFVDGMGIIFEALSEMGATIIGKTSSEGYSHTDSRADIEGEFVGLALDDNANDNDSKMSSWVESINSQL